MIIRGKRGTNKKGLELAFLTIVIMVLAIILLVFLVIIFTRTSGTFREAIANFFTTSNVDSVIKVCNLNVQAGQSYEYCCVSKDVRLSTRERYNMTCSQANEMSWGKEINKMRCEDVC